jgi:UDP-N-acetylmuramoyl-tripeptide--D-alanyl-D-alanine ligase
VGKTSTKMAAAAILSTKYKTLFQEGNYNDYVSVPLIYFERRLPNIYNPLAWLLVFLKNEISIRRNYPHQVVLAEIGTDTKGDIEEFSKYLKAKIGVLTAITPEHMEYFKTLDAVAEEELTIAKLTDKLLVNKDLCDAKYLVELKQAYQTYGLNQPANYELTHLKFNELGADFELHKDGKLITKAKHEAIVEPQLYAVLAAAAVAKELRLSSDQIRQGIDKVQAYKGRMNILPGVNNSRIIDDTYNASPEAVKAALSTLYRLEAPHKIAVLGNMNELGEFSKQAHEQIGELCDPQQLDLVLTIGPDANEYLATAAEAKGCRVQRFESPYQAGGYLRPILEEGSLVLVKGSQNRVYAEETVKLLLADPTDASKLVRQDPSWLVKKQKSFGVVT